MNDFRLCLLCFSSPWFASHLLLTPLVLVSCVCLKRQTCLGRSLAVNLCLPSSRFDSLIPASFPWFIQRVLSWTGVYFLFPVTDSTSRLLSCNCCLCINVRKECNPSIPSHPAFVWSHRGEKETSIKERRTGREEKENFLLLIRHHHQEKAVRGSLSLLSYPAPCLSFSQSSSSCVFISLPFFHTLVFFPITLSSCQTTRLQRISSSFTDSELTSQPFFLFSGRKVTWSDSGKLFPSILTSFVSVDLLQDVKEKRRRRGEEKERLLCKTWIHRPSLGSVSLMIVL